ncbi:hypothetical protein [Kitasatospora sp. NPDC097643]|uniref:hypothetical protein n=1 Tax=Kitasatospora sp. NPDC097643 TaxID=3157230 RepID=UPI00331A8D40
MLIIGYDGLAYHIALFASGSWQGWNAVQGVGSAQIFAASSIAIAGMPNGDDAQLVVVGNEFRSHGKSGIFPPPTGRGTKR